MLNPHDSRRALSRLFRRRPIADLPLLLKTLETRSPMSVFRRLADVGYISSYSHAGRYYTLADIPVFDDHGLWQYQGVSFSKHGSLKNTAEHLIRLAPAGHTHLELQLRLRIRLHNTLLDLLRSNRIRREALQDCFVYMSNASRQASAQLAERRRMLAAAQQPDTASARPLVVDVLLEIIHGADRVPAPGEVVARLLERGIQATLRQVEAVFLEYQLKKTRRSR